MELEMVDEGVRECIADLLESSAALLEKEGWIQGEYEQEQNGKMAYCSVGALRARCRNFLELEEAKRQLCRVIGYDPEICSTEEVITAWNDHMERTKQEVLDAFHKATKMVLGVES